MDSAMGIRLTIIQISKNRGGAQSPLQRKSYHGPELPNTLVLCLTKASRINV